MIHQPTTKISRRYLLFGFLVIFLLATVAQAGTLDPSFGNGGKVVTDIPNNGSARKVFVLSDGKILVVGPGNFPATQPPFPAAYTVAVRYNSNGTLDTSFGNNGILVDSAPLNFTTAFLQPDGKICVVATAHNGFQSYDNFEVMRLNPDGTRDTAFGTNGRVITDYGGMFDIAKGGVLVSDKIVVAGHSVGTSTSSGTVDLARYNANGTLDTSFGDNGIWYHFHGAINTTPYVQNMVLLNDGKFFVLGVDYAARFNADGSLDQTFGVGGFANGGGNNIFLQPDGKFLVSLNNQTGYTFTFMRRNSDWSVDTTFGVNGTVQTQFRAAFGNFNGDLNDIAVKSNGEIFATGRVYGNNIANMPVARYSSNGTLLAQTTVSISNGEVAFAIAIQPDNKIVLAGSNADIAVVRLTDIVNDAQFFYHRTYDFNGDGKDDIAVYRPGSGGGSSVWYSTTASSPYWSFGLAGDIIAPGDFTGDGIADLTVFRPSTGYWYIANSLVSPGTNYTAVSWGSAGDIPAAGDFDGDGKDDVAVFRPSTGVWYIRNSADVSLRAVQWGASSDIPVVGDYDGDGKCDVAVYRPANGVWYILRSSDSQAQGTQFGAAGDVPVKGDYDGDHKTEIAVFRPSTGVWYLLNSAGNTFSATYWGAANDTPAPGDFDGDGKTDFAVVRSNGTTGFWYILKSTTNTMQSQQWGLATDTPVPGK